MGMMLFLNDGRVCFGKGGFPPPPTLDFGIRCLPPLEQNPEIRKHCDYIACLTNL